MAEREPSSRLEVRDLAAGWDATSVVRGADLDVSPGELVAVLGGNGSGKSTLLWAVAGLLRARRGRVRLDGRDVSRMGAERRAALGLRLLAQTRRVFPSLSVRENLECGALALGRPDPAALRLRLDGWLDRFPDLVTFLDRPAATLSGGQQQVVAIGRVVASRPRVLLLDEPSAGLAPALAARCGAVFTELAAEGVAVVLVEQQVDLARRLATRVLVMHDGAPVAESPPLTGPSVPGPG